MARSLRRRAVRFGQSGSNRGALFSLSRWVLLAVLAFAQLPATALGQSGDDVAPRTPWGHPDLQGVWGTSFLTGLERPQDIDDLVVGPEQAQAIAARILGRTPDNNDPQISWEGVKQLAVVKGEYRTSVIIDPPDGRMPFTQTGMDLVVGVRVRFFQAFDHPEQRPLEERCMENWGYPPIRSFPVLLLHQIVQTPAYVVMRSEGAVPVRVIHLGGHLPSETLRSVEGHSVGRWEGATLVVKTTHFRADEPSRGVTGRRPLLLSRDTEIAERFTRVSDTALLYQFTVEDDHLYTQPWTGEFSLRQHDGPVYEFACHEGNYSLPTILRGGRVQAAVEQD